MKISFIECSKTNETDVRDPQEFLFMKKTLISVLFFCVNLKPWHAPHLWLVIPFHLSWYTLFLSHPESVQGFCNFSNNLPFTPSLLKPQLKTPHTQASEWRRFSYNSNAKPITCHYSMQRAYSSVWAYQNDCKRTEGGNMKKGARDRKRERERGGGGGSH